MVRYATKECHYCHGLFPANQLRQITVYEGKGNDYYGKKARTAWRCRDCGRRGIKIIVLLIVLAVGGFAAVFTAKGGDWNGVWTNMERSFERSNR